MCPPQYLSLEDAQRAILSHLLTEGRGTSPRGVATVESRALSFTLLSPRHRCILNRERRWSLPLALGELCWHLSGSTQAEALTYYAPTWQSFADADGQIRGSCYGSKVFLSADGCSPWMRARNLLQSDRDTRRAVLYFNDASSHLVPGCRDAACANSLQFFIREGILDAVVCMRSNDVIWGLPYDVFLFTFLQEMMAANLGVELGSYHHFAASLHLYAKHRSLAERILKCEPPTEFRMPPLENPAGIQTFLDFERRIRLDIRIDNEQRNLIEECDAYWHDLVQVLRMFRSSKDIGWTATLNSATDVAPYLPVLESLASQSR
jgi:thymidylate synthase